MTEILKLRLYIAGNAPNSVSALANARAICATHFATCHELEVVDLLTEPRRAMNDGIIVTPTLLKLWPEPMRRLIGNLADAANVMALLGAK